MIVIPQTVLALEGSERDICDECYVYYDFALRMPGFALRRPCAESSNSLVVAARLK